MHSYPRPGMVVLSIVVAILASYATLGLAGQAATDYGQARNIWLGGGALLLGTGIWAVHFVAMLAFYLPTPIPASRAEAF
jgi:NO-binding membrane sensor protein with MHYT domain